MRKIKCPICGQETEPILKYVTVDEPVVVQCEHCGTKFPMTSEMYLGSDIDTPSDPVNNPSHYVGKIECIDYLRDKLTPEEFTGFCMGNVLKYSSRWRKKDGLQDLKKAKVYLEWAIENEEKTEVKSNA